MRNARDQPRAAAQAKLLEGVIQVVAEGLGVAAGEPPGERLVSVGGFGQPLGTVAVSEGVAAYPLIRPLSKVVMAKVAGKIESQ